MGVRLVHRGGQAYLGRVPRPASPPMSKQRYRITVTPIEPDGRPSPVRNSLEFEQRSSDNWNRTLETFERQRGACGDRCTALAVSIELLRAISTDPAGDDRATAGLRPELDALLAAVARLPRDG